MMGGQGDHGRSGEVRGGQGDQWRSGEIRSASAETVCGGKGSRRRVRSLSRWRGGPACSDSRGDVGLRALTAGGGVGLRALIAGGTWRGARRGL